MRRFLGTAMLFVCLGAVTCGGRVLDDRVFGSGGASGASFTSDVTGGPMTGIGAGTGATSGSSTTSGPGTTSGPVTTTATTGPSMTTGFTTTTGGTGGVATTSGTTTTTTTGGFGGSGPPLPDPKTGCAIVCARWASCGGYPRAQCEMDCTNTWVQSTQCTPQFSNFLGCLSVAPFQCSPKGPVPSGCDAEQAAFTMCSQPQPLPQCGSVKPPAAMSCSGSAGGGSVTAGSTGGPSTAQCQNICFDGQNNIWISNCVGNSCTCSFNGKAYCACMARGDACSSRGCCPGL